METRGRHLAHRVWWKKWWAIAAAVGLVAVGGATGVVLATANHGPSPAAKAAAQQKVVAAQQAAHAAAVHTAQVQLASTVTVSPANLTAGVDLNAPVVISTSSGTLASVHVVDTSGQALAGAVNAAETQWHSTGPLQPSITYRVAVSVTRPDGITAQRETTFATLTPAVLVSATVYPSDGMSVGVGQPVVVEFNQDIAKTAAQASVLSHFVVSMSTPVPGAWYWFNEHELHFRPKTFWPSGDRINVTSNLSGWNAGDGQWGTGQVSDTFSIGDSRISVANLSTEVMTVTLNGHTVATYPISGGRPQYPTMDGVHIVLDRETVVHMVSSTVGIPVNSPNGYNEYVYDDVHISDSGEYVHAAPWSVGSQGVTNVSHGCINVSPSNALSFFNFSRVGDVVEVVGGPRPPATGDHGVMDWSGPAWSQWTPATIHKLA